MNIHGLQKMTLLDYPGKVACTVFLSGCDFRCPYCHNYELAEGKVPALMDDEGLLTFLGKRKGLLEGVAITGGEPCLHAGLPGLLSSIRQLGYAIKLDTNGNHPDMLAHLLKEGLVDYVAMDIKNSPEKYAITTGLADPESRKQPEKHDHFHIKPDGSPAFPNLTPIRKSIALLMDSGLDYEFRTTVVKEFHEAEDFHKIGELIRGARRYFLQLFTDRDTVPFEGFHAPSPEEMAQYLAIVSEYVSEARIRGME